jgi:hypothetical protein
MMSPLVHRKLTQYAQKTVAKARVKLKRKPLPTSSSLIRSINYKIIAKATFPTIEFSFNQYGEYVDSGRRRGAPPPPIKPISEWVKRKGIDISPYAISKSISKKGIPKYEWIDESFPSDKKPNSRVSLEFQYLLEELTVDQIEYDMDQLQG